MTYRVGVIGAGIIGLAVARRLGQQEGYDVTVFEQESDVAAHQTGHNSGVVHAGVYYPPGSLKARLCREGARRLKEFCAARDLPYREIGKVVVARSAAEVPRLRDIEARATANGVPGLRWLGPAELAGIEPHVRGVAALHSPSTAITDYRAVARAMAGDLEAAGGRLRLGQRVTGIDRQGDRAVVRTAADAVTVDRLVICAGLQSNRVAALAGDGPAPAIVPFRGEYYRLVPERAYLISGLVYPVPDPAYPFLGVHFTPRVDGTVDIGPNAVLATAREGYRRRDVNLADLRDVLGWPGFRRLARVHWRQAWPRRGRRCRSGGSSRGPGSTCPPCRQPTSSRHQPGSAPRRSTGTGHWWTTSGSALPVPWSASATPPRPRQHRRWPSPITSPARRAPRCTADPARGRLLTGKARARIHTGWLSHRAGRLRSVGRMHHGRAGVRPSYLARCTRQ